MPLSSANTLIPGMMLFSVVQGVILIVLLLKLRKGSRLGHRILACLIFFFTFHLVSNLFDEFGLLADESLHSTLFEMSLICVALTVAPLIYLYIDVITRKTVNILTRSFWLHFLPAALYLFCSIPLLISDISIQVDADIQVSYFDVLTLFVLFFCLVQIFIYLIFSFLKLRQHNQTIKSFFSATERINLHWLRNILIGFALFYFIVLLQFFVEPFSVAKLVDDILTLSMVALVYLLGYMGMQQADIFGKEIQALTQDVPPLPVLGKTEHVAMLHEYKPSLVEVVGESEAQTDDTDMVSETVETVKEQTEDTASPPESKKEQTQTTEQKQEKYQKSALDKETSKLLFDDLLTFMEEKRPYLENNISLSELAKQVKLSPNYLSQIINEQSQTNFFDFINRYRVSHFKTLLAEQLKDNKTSNMIDMALASGFNSKSAFYTAFKKYESMTPSQYKKSL